MRAHVASLLPAAGIAMALAGCSDMGKPVKPVERLARAELSATSLDFGTVAVSGTASRSVTVSNTGNAPLPCAAVVACAPYQITSGGGLFSLAPGERRTVTVSFTPSTTGPFPCTLDLGPQCPPVPLSGSGALQLPGAQCTLSRTALVFGGQSVSTSSFDVFQVSSTGTDPLLVDIVPSCPDFRIAAGGGPAQIAPGGSITVTVEFRPVTGGPHTCQIAVGPGCPDVSVTGDGTTVSYAGKVRPVFENGGCLGCHGFPSSDYTGMLSSYGRFVNVTSFGYGPALIVKPYDATNSVLWNKIENTDPNTYGPLMPQGGQQMPQAQRDLIRTWILEGAHDN